ncbi:MAG: N-acetyl sugar amidotransferase [Endomicrobiaceae bacterium]|nr:N-acetyl sugar amidotransferase [Endomicrobiaceae bacterium]MDD3922733.1 N-acetyl sugar amidotransferase [Endomicrobiaceae bacterium]
MAKQICTRCIQDETIPKITFDKDGVCNYCHLHDELCKMFPNDERGQHRLQSIIDNMKLKSKNNEFDCVVGISGGRDSTYLLYNAAKVWKLRVLAVHSDDWFDNSIASENMKKAVEKLNVKFINVKYPLELACELKRDFLKASVPDLNMGTDIAIATSLYSMAYKYGIKHILIGQSFRTEGIKPLEWSFFDGKYLKTVHKMFGSLPLGKWSPEDPGYNLDLKELFYYTVIKNIKTILPNYYINYIRKDAEEIISNELGWIYPGAHYFDDLYHSLITYIHRVKFNMCLNINSDAALVRSGQMERELGIKRANEIYHIEKLDVIEECLKRINVSQTEFEKIMKLPIKTFKDYDTSYNTIKKLKYPIKFLSQMQLIPKIAFKKYFEFGA